MLKLSTAAQEIINKNPLLKWGLSYRLLNLTKLASFIKPQIEARTKKEVKASAILMTLSRMQNISSKLSPKPENFPIENITFRTNLTTMTFLKTKPTQEKINLAHKQIQEEGSFISISEGTNEITLATEEKHIPTIEKFVSKTPVNRQDSLTAIHIKFMQEYNDQPGFLFLVIQQLTLQHINIVEITSTFSELIVYIDSKESRLAFDTLVTSF